MLTKEDLANIKELMNEQISDMKEQMSNMEEEMSSMKGEIWGIKENMVTKKEFSNLENQMDDLEQEVHELRDYSHKKFVLIENEVVPKIAALYEMSDSYVKQVECLKRREQTDEKMDCLGPLKAIAKSHSEQLLKHNEMLDKLVTNAG